jgi:cbb3-type cytochrome oxidase maturation protein
MELEILYLLVPLSLVLVVVIGVIFWWAVRRGQFDDLEGPAYQILFDDEPIAKKSQSKEEK